MGMKLLPAVCPPDGLSSSGEVPEVCGTRLDSLKAVPQSHLSSSERRRDRAFVFNDRVEVRFRLQAGLDHSYEFVQTPEAFDLCAAVEFGRIEGPSQHRDRF